jgi:ABC-type dipeptide/oligopeptide/nickel transport system permease component
VLPATTLAIAFTPVLARVARTALVESLREPWAVALRARGVSSRRLLVAHALPNTVVPLVMIAGHQAGSLLSGAALTEIVFAWPGLGRLLLDASFTRDAPLIMAVFVAAVVLVVLANLVADVGSLAIDPRVEAG